MYRIQYLKVSRYNANVLLYIANNAFISESFACICGRFIILRTKLSSYTNRTNDIRKKNALNAYMSDLQFPTISQRRLNRFS